MSITTINGTACYRRGRDEQSVRTAAAAGPSKRATLAAAYAYMCGMTPKSSQRTAAKRAGYGLL